MIERTRRRLSMEVMEGLSPCLEQYTTVVIDPNDIVLLRHELGWKGFRLTEVLALRYPILFDSLRPPSYKSTDPVYLLPMRSPVFVFRWSVDLPISSHTEPDCRLTKLKPGKVWRQLRYLDISINVEISHLCMLAESFLLFNYAWNFLETSISCD